MTRSLVIAIVAALLGFATIEAPMANAADVTVQPAVLHDATGVPGASLLSTNVSDATAVTPVRWGRYYAYRPYYGYYAYRPYYYYRPYAYRPYYYRPYYAYRPYYYGPYGYYYYW